ncbi:MAG: ribonuclease E/G, partial [Ramlibacter sp.]
FGLMEMSRQRLRPALSEGASIPCPRCGGHGHIRDTESSALQILRIIQEESMKDGTAAVHVQVPVEVASFLLNEKRPEIAKIELKQRISVIMVPNKTLETPNYRLERLKHDDARLDSIKASYHMAEEIEDPTAVTRRSHERTNKQEPVIKGVLPDAPAPIVVPKPEPVKAAEPVARKPAPAPVVAPAPAEHGFMGWIKSLFGAAPAPAPVAAPAPAAEGRKDEKREGGRGDSRRGGRGRDGERRDGRRGEGRGGEGRGDGRARDGEQRRERGERAEAGDGQPRNEGGRQRDGEQRRGERGERQERGGERQGRGEARGDRDNREPRGERQGQREPRDADQRAPMDATAGADGVTAEQRQDRQPRGERGERGEGRRERGDGRRGDRRGDRGPREQAPAGEGVEAAALAGAAASVGMVADTGHQQAPAADPVLESHTHQDVRPADGQDGEERRERRSRDRYGRDRRERGDRQPREEGAPTAEAAVNGAPEQAERVEQAERAERLRYPTGFVNDEAEPAVEAAAPVNFAQPVAQPVAAPVAAPVAVKPSAAPAPVSAGLPKVQSFQLPVDQLAQVAEGSGLQWINSDAAKIAAVQAAIAAEPKPMRVPRERPPAIVVDEGPLVLVETKRDLREMKLPFEQATLPLQ